MTRDEADQRGDEANEPHANNRIHPLACGIKLMVRWVNESSNHRTDTNSNTEAGLLPNQDSDQQIRVQINSETEKYVENHHLEDSAKTEPPKGGSVAGHLCQGTDLSAYK